MDSYRDPSLNNENLKVNNKVNVKNIQLQS
jgi:hypothetical protein